MWLIVMRIGQGVGGAMLFANSTAILTDAFPAHQRGMALGINQVAAIAGSFLGLVVGGLLAEWDWRAVFWVSVPIGILGTIWGYKSLVELGERRRAKHRHARQHHLRRRADRAAGRRSPTASSPTATHSTGWTNPWVLAGIIGGVALLVVFVVIEQRVEHPMLSIDLFKIRAFSMGNLAGLLASVGRGGLQFMLIIWLQGIWLPLHGYNYESTPLWAGIYMLPLTVGFLVAGPASGLALRPLRRAAVRHGRPAGGRGELRRPAADPGRLLLLALRARSCSSTASAAACSPRRTPRRS